MKNLKQALSFGGILTQNDVNVFIDEFSFCDLKAGEYLHKTTEVAKKIFFIEAGIVRVYTSDEHGNDVTKYFAKESQFVTDLESYYSGTASENSIQSVISSEIYSIKKSSIDRLILTIPNLYIYLKTITEAHLLNKLKDNDFLNYGDSKTKYIEFINRHPFLAQNVPQQYIASYLRIQPQSLSRIRRELLKK